MNLLERFLCYIKDQELGDPRQDRILVAVSGGKDSMLLARLLLDAGFDIAVAHCNFCLRGEESDGDEALVRTFVAQHQIPSFFKRFQTSSYASANGLSTQMAARELRYNWFEYLRQKGGFRFIAVAHHSNDDLETVLVNLLRGTGLRGLRGMLPKSNHIIRPLLFLSADEVSEAVRDLQIPYRDDSSNFSTDYQRNKLRLEVIPLLKQINPQLEMTHRRNVEILQQTEVFVQHEMDALKEKLFTQTDAGIKFNISALSGHHSAKFVLHELLQPFNFNSTVISDISMHLTGSMQLSGKQFFSATHQILLDRTEAWIKAISDQPSITANETAIPSQGHTHSSFISISEVELKQSPTYSVKRIWKSADQRIHTLKIQHVSKTEQAELLSEKERQMTIDLDGDQLTWPLTLRKWRVGDRFKPHGMSGKSKKLSDFYISLKLTRWEKDEVNLLCDGNDHILWVMPYRRSEEAKPSDSSKNVLRISYFCEDGR